MATLTTIKNDFVNNITGYSAMGILLSTCLGSIAVLLALMNFNIYSMAVVMVTVLICSFHNAAILTVQKPIVIFRFLVASVIINVAIIAAYLVFA